VIVLVPYSNMAPKRPRCLFLTVAEALIDAHPGAGGAGANCSAMMRSSSVLMTSSLVAFVAERRETWDAARRNCPTQKLLVLAHTPAQTVFCF
jgi:hypothetical protein